MRCNRSRLAVALSLLLTAQSAQAGPMWTGRIEKRNPGAFLDVRMENSQAPTAAHDGYGGDGDQTTPRPVFETLNSTPEPNPLLSENQGDDKKKGPYSDLPEPIEVIPVQPTSDAPEKTSEAQDSTQEPANKPTFTQNPSAPVLTTSIVPKDPTTVAEKPTSAEQSDYKPPKDTAVVSETAPVTKEIPTSTNEAPTSEPVNDATTVVPEVPTTEAAQKPENTGTQSLSSTLDLGTIHPSDGEETKPSAVEETTAPEAPSAPATTAPGNEQPTSAVEEETTTFAYQPTPTGYLTTKAPSDTAFPVNHKHPTQVYPKPSTTSEGPLEETSTPETESPAGTTRIVSVVEPEGPQSQTTSDAQSQPAPTSGAAQPETQAPVSEPAQPSNPAPTSQVHQSYVPVQNPSGQQPDTPAATTAPAQPQNPVPTSQPAQPQPGVPASTAPSQPQNPVPTSEPTQAQPETPVTSQVQQPEAPAVTSAVQKPTSVPSNGQPQYPAPDSNTQPAVPAAPPTSTVLVSDPSAPETTSAPKVVPSGTSASGVPTINPGVPTGTSAIPASAYASNVVDARTYNEEFAKLTPESSCMKGQAACINGQTGVCDDTGKFQLTPCNTKGEKCFALPLYNFEGGIKIVCEDPATAAKILGGTPSSGEDNTVPGNGNGGKEQPATTSTAEKPAVPVVTVTTIVTVDDGAAPEPTGEPATDQPSQPAQQPSQATQPANGQTSQPGYQQPSQPQPVPEQPTQPAPEQTSHQSAPEEPSQPQPLPEKSTQPVAEQPSQPAQTQPAEAQPSQPSEEKPSQTNPAEPSNPQPTKAYEDLPPTSVPVAEQSTTSVPLPGDTTLTKSIKKPDEAKPTGSPDDDDNNGQDGNDKGKDGHDDDDKPTSVVLIPIPDKPTDAPSPAATEAKVDNEGSKDDKKPAAVTRTGDDAHATTIVVDGTPTVSVYFTVTVTEKDQATVTVTEKEKETVTLVISA
ncbi:hypothetical protein FVEG_04968 [Fusarium verticillioides 7600]|uniref:Carbohydrate-binding module family 19 domain-containing protein n=1 Tax=Gibberella moniliformis (strain M3125 / FGSC 7600) TaxID=334819 RepID=W7M7G5_GIBM7|nr:hypothetical protein FVEG_04968 [Fusarium verticillioides 7600]EWG43545.1 hypothetical protein FVEG_04968 [Fusarium verticillioides 7600]